MLLSKPKEDSETIWVVSPFLGLSFVTVIMQNFIYMNIPIKTVTPWLWSGAAAIWIWLMKSGRCGVIMRKISFLVILSASGVYLIQGLGLLIAGADTYVGRAWHDQFNYTSIAQFLTDYPFSFSIAEVQGQPYLYEGILKKFDHIGVSIIQGFLGKSTFPIQNRL